MLETALALEVRHLVHVSLRSPLVETRSLEVRVAVVKPAGPGLRVMEGLGRSVGMGQRQGRGKEERQHALELHLERLKLKGRPMELFSGGR